MGTYSEGSRQRGLVCRKASIFGNVSFFRGDWSFEDPPLLRNLDYLAGH